MNRTRDALQRVATHVVARARFSAAGRFGLRATPGGFGTPAFGDAVEVLRVDLGASPGDSYSDEPYIYVGPWGADRPGDPSYWNAPFGAVVRRGELLASPDPYAAGVDFLRRGLELLR